MFEKNFEPQKGEAIEHAIGMFKGQPKAEIEAERAEKEAEKEND